MLKYIYIYIYIYIYEEDRANDRACVHSERCNTHRNCCIIGQLLLDLYTLSFLYTNSAWFCTHHAPLWRNLYLFIQMNIMFTKKQYLTFDICFSLVINTFQSLTNKNNIKCVTLDQNFSQCNYIFSQAHHQKRSPL